MANTFTEDVGSLGDPTSALPQGSYRYGGPNGKRICVRMGVLAVGSGGGGADPADFPASLFNLDSITECSNLIADDDGAVYVASPSFDQSGIITTVNSDDDNDASDVPEDSYRIVVKGYK